MKLKKTASFDIDATLFNNVYWIKNLVQYNDPESHKINKDEMKKNSYSAFINALTQHIYVAHIQIAMTFYKLIISRTFLLVSAI